MTTLAPIELNFYDDNDQLIKTERRARIPSYLLDTAIQLQAELAKNPEHPKTDALFNFIVEFYGHKFTLEEVKKQTDLVECMAVLRSVLARASQLAREFSNINP